MTKSVVGLMRDVMVTETLASRFALFGTMGSPMSAGQVTSAFDVLTRNYPNLPLMWVALERLRFA
jgi:hypothetical protein